VKVSTYELTPDIFELKLGWYEIYLFDGKAEEKEKTER